MLHGSQRPGHKARENVRKVVHLITLLQQHKIPGFLLLLDIYKAFDTLSWDYLPYVLQRWDSGDSILSWLQLSIQLLLPQSAMLDASLPPFPSQEE